MEVEVYHSIHMKCVPCEWIMDCIKKIVYQWYPKAGDIFRCCVWRNSRQPMEDATKIEWRDWSARCYQVDSSFITLMSQPRWLLMSKGKSKRIFFAIKIIILWFLWRQVIIWTSVVWTSRNKHRWKCDRNQNIFIQENAFWYVVS